MPCFLFSYSNNRVEAVIFIKNSYFLQLPNIYILNNPKLLG